MKNVSYFLIILLFVCCKENSKPLMVENLSTSNARYQRQEQVKWNLVELKNFKFKLPNNFTLDNNMSSYNNKVYVSQNNKISLTVDISVLPESYKNSDIEDIIRNLNDFGTSINIENNKHVDDFKLISTEKSNLGNKKSIVVNQTSSKISEKNPTSMVNSHFVINSPYYMSVSFFYPKNSYQDYQLINKIRKSFIFEK